jgi:hypothetical protein
MISETVPPIIDFFSDIKDPRIERRKCYPLIEVIIITLLAVMAFAKGWEDIEVIAIDGKTLRGSFNTRQGNKAIHLVGAWATENRLVVAQVTTGEKSGPYPIWWTER